MGATYSNLLNRRKQMASQLYCCNSLLTSQELCLMDKYLICAALEYGNILYAGVASAHLQWLDHLQSRIEQTCC